MISKHNIQEKYHSLKHLTKDIKAKTYEAVLEISNNSVNENINLDKIDVNSTTFANLFIYGLLVSLLFIDQIRSMLFYNLEHIGKDPIWTTFWMCLFSFSVYTFSKFVSIRRNKILRNRLFGESISEDEQLKFVPEVNKEDTGDLFFYLIPIGFQIYFILISIKHSYNDFDIALLYRFNVMSILFLFFFVYVFRWAIFNAKKDYSFGNIRIRRYVDRNKIYVLSILTIVIISILGYYMVTHVKNGFTGNYGIGVFDLLIVFLISIRGLFAFIYYLYYKSPPIRELSNNQLYFQKIGNTILPLGPKSYFYFLLSIVAAIAFYIYPINPYYNEILNIDIIPLSQLDAKERKRMSIETYSINWMNNRQNNDPIFLIAGQGGGSRAGFWTSSALSYLHASSDVDGESFFYKNCFAISTVSGSSVGASLYLNTVNNLQENVFSALNRNNLIDFFDRDYISSSILRLFFINPFQKLCSYPRWGRNDVLMSEEKIEYKRIFMSDSLDYRAGGIMTYDSVFPVYYENDSLNYMSPLFFPNTYNVDMRKKSIISSVSFGKDYAHEDLISVMLNEENDSIEAKGILSIGTAVNLSQMFPIMSASARYNNCHYYDGGVYDNSGLSTVRDVYSVIAPLRDMYKPESQIIVIYLKNGIDTISVNPMPQSFMTTLIKAASGSIFSANTNRHIQKFEKSALKLNDTLITDIEYDKNVILNRWLSPSDCDSMLTELESIFAHKELKNILTPKMNLRKKLPKSHTYSVYFDNNDSLLTASDIVVIDNLFSGIRPNSITLKGVADSSGDEGYNKRLSLARAEAVKKFIVDTYDYKPTVIHTKGLGESGDKTNESKQSNRRVDISFDFYQSNSGYFSAPFSGAE